ncbi:MAG: enoyl-ACP reductase FabI [Solirubrobacterales bacterium]
MILEGKRILITGVVNGESIAFATAARAQELGAQVALSAFPRDLEKATEAEALLPEEASVFPADLVSEEDVLALQESIGSLWGGLDGALHAIAFAPRSALAGEFMAAPADDLNIAFQTSAVSYAALGRLLRDLSPGPGSSLVGLDFDAVAAWPVYNWMGVCKAALESANRYLARDLGELGIRSNLIAAGPIHTRAAGGIPDFDVLLNAWETRSPLPWDPTDSGPVADAACFLFSDLSRAVTGEILHVDGGYHAMATALRPAREAS